MIGPGVEIPDRKLDKSLKMSVDSDSGHEPTFSSASNSSEDLHNEVFNDVELTTEPSIGGPAMSDDLTKSWAQLDLKDRLKETAKILDMALNNRFATALERCQPIDHEQDLYKSLACATLSFLRATLTLERAHVEAALKAVQDSFDISSKYRKGTSTTSMVVRLLYRPNYNSYTDDECHAELVHADSILIFALISFISDQSLICLVKGAFRLRSCYQRYKECLYIMENRRDWGSEEARIHFESGVRMGYGTFNLLMSFLPRRVLRILEYVGFSGDRVIGVSELQKSIATNDGLRSNFSALIVLTYYSYVENLFGLGNYDAEGVRELNNTLKERFPDSAFFLLFRGRYHQMEGDLDEAVEAFESSIKAQNDWAQFHSISHWEIMWCHAVRMNWEQAAHYADLLRKRSKWSEASYQYQYGTFLYAQLVEEERQGLCPSNSDEYNSRMTEIREIIEKVPELRIRYAGKTLPAEKFAIMRSQKFCQQNNRLTLPAIEFLYIWNIFVTLKNSPTTVGLLLDRINNEIEHIESIMKLEGHNINGMSVTTSNINEKYNETNTEQDLDNDDDTKHEEERYSDDRVSETDSNSESSSRINHWIDDLSLALLLKGMCLKSLGELDEAEKNFMKVMEYESDIEEDSFLAPHAAMELALLKLAQKKFASSRKWIKKARNQYTGYLHETIVHFRLHAASRLIRLELEDSSFNSSSSSADSNVAQAIESNSKLVS